MTEPWLQDACSLVDAFRAGTLSPTEALEATLDAVQASDLNAVCHVDAEAARARAAAADVSLPFGGVPIGVKELEHVEGWPYSEASVVFADRSSAFDSTHVARLRAAGAVLAVQTTASEFGGVNCTSTKLHGVTRNPWDTDRTPGGSSGGSAAAVAGGLVPIATGGDGGGSIRIPAGFTGLLGLKATYGRIPRGPADTAAAAHRHPRLPVPLGARHGPLVRRGQRLRRPRQPEPAPGVGLGGRARLGRPGRQAGGRVGRPRRRGGRAPGGGHGDEAAEALIADAGLRRVDVAVQLPQGGLEWALSNLVGLVEELGDRYPACNDDLTPEIQIGMNLATHHFTVQSAGKADAFRVALNEQMADLFEQADVVFAATNPDIAFDAPGPCPPGSATST